MDNLFDTPSFVSRPASEARARREGFDGTFTHRKNCIMNLLLSSSARGMTWKQVAELTKEHHGQVSAALSNLHQNGFIFSLRIQRDKCHPYVHHAFRDNFHDNDVYDSPAQTKAGVIRASYVDFASAVEKALDRAENDAEQYGWALDNFMSDIRNAIQELRDRQSEP